MKKAIEKCRNLSNFAEYQEKSDLPDFQKIHILQCFSKIPFSLLISNDAAYDKVLLSGKVEILAWIVYILKNGL